MAAPTSTVPGEISMASETGEAHLNEELSEARWVEPAAVAGLPTTPGLAAIVTAAFEQLRERRS